MAFSTRWLIFLIVPGVMSAGGAVWLRGARAESVTTESVTTESVTGKPAALAAEPIDFNRDIRPILSDNCFACHGPDPNTRAAALRLDLGKHAFAKLESGRFAIVPGDAAASELMRRISSDDPEVRMPPPDAKKTLTAEQIALLGRWIESGATWQEHWAWMAPVRPTLPNVARADWANNPIDRFVLARLEEEGLQPSPPADRPTLIRRVSFDLTGLPPTLAMLDEAMADDRPDWYERYVDRLLDTPQYGERMAQHWLDLARYADSDGYHDDTTRNMWRYRDYVIESFNGNKPFNAFVVEQIAGDMIPNATLDQMMGSAFNRCGPTSSEGGADAKEYAAKYAVDRVVTTATVFLGITMQCAECHDHKFDPFTTKEFYQLYAFFNQVPEDYLYRGLYAPPSIEAPTAEQQAQLAALQREIDAWRAERQAAATMALRDLPAWEAQRAQAAEPPVPLDDLLAIPANERSTAQQAHVQAAFLRDVPTVTSIDGEIAAVEQRITALKKQVPRLRIMRDVEARRPTHILVRGDYRTLGEEVAANVPAVLGPLPGEGPHNRMDLARWLVSDDQPLVARVAVNRWWQMVFGVGIVKTTGDFGSQAEWPSHPELLDWLAVEFRESGWDVKHIMRLIVTSNTYRQRSRTTPELLTHDPENRLLARGPRFRLSAEMVRDNALSIAGLLDRNRAVGGPSVKPYQPGDLWREMAYGDSPDKGYVQSHGPDLYRRSVYTFWKRSVLYPAFVAFDAPNREVCTSHRPTTNTPLQALVTLNDVTYVEAARVFAANILKQPEEERFDFAFRTALSREATEGELAAMRSLLEDARSHYRVNVEAARQLIAAGEWPRDEELDEVEHAAWTAVCNAMLNFDATLTKE